MHIKVDMCDKHGVSATFNIDDLPPFVHEEELGTILFEARGNEPSSVDLCSSTRHGVL